MAGHRLLLEATKAAGASRGTPIRAEHMVTTTSAATPIRFRILPTGPV